MNFWAPFLAGLAMGFSISGLIVTIAGHIL